MEKKFLGSTGLAKFLEHLYNVFSQVGHTHTKSQITDFPTIPTKVSQLTNDSGFVSTDTNTTYTLSKIGYAITLTGTDGSSQTVYDSDSTISVDSELSNSSTNPVQNKIIKAEFDEVQSQLDQLSSEKLDSSAIASWAKASSKPSYTASEVGAVPSTRTVNGKTLSSNISLSASDVGADPSGTANTKVSAHNTATDAHNDIRLLINDLTTRLNALADSDDVTLDQMSEVVAYIKSNKSLIEQVTTNKVNVSDIINNLTTNASNKPLSAAQGVVIKSLIDALQSTLDGKADANHSHNYAGSASAGGAATSANKLNANAGDSNTPVYFSNGVPVACTSLDLNTTGSAAKLATARTIALNGAVSGSTTFDGSGNVSITTSNGQHISNRGSGTCYYKLGTMVADNAGNYGNITISGRLGGWEQSNSANFEIMMLNRSSARDGNTITATVSASGNTVGAFGSCDIVVYKQDDTSEIVYLKLSGYWLYDFDWSVSQHSINYSATNVTPTGTLVWSLSGAPKTILSSDGTLHATKFSGSFDGTIENATKATKDASGNVITDTYMTKVNPTGSGNVSIGRKSGTATGDKSVVIGTDATASNKNTVAIGYNASATNDYGVAIGYGAVASGEQSTAIGTAPKATGKQSTALGVQSTASGEYATSMGCWTTSAGVAGTSLGNGSTVDVNSWAAVSSGIVTTARGLGQHVFGSYNIPDAAVENYSTPAEHLLIVGNGDVLSESGVQSNAMTVDWDGNAWFSGDVYVGSTSGTNQDDGAVKLSKEGHDHNSSYYTKTQSNSRYYGTSRGSLDVDTCYDGKLYMVSSGSNVPCGEKYGVVLGIPYRQLSGNERPDFGAQIFIPNGDDSQCPNSMFFRTSLADTWQPWQEVATISNLEAAIGSAIAASY